MNANNLPQTPLSTSTSTSIGRRTSLWPYSYERRLERSTERDMLTDAAGAFRRSAQIRHATQDELDRIDGQVAAGAARVHGAAEIQQTETQALIVYGNSADATLAQASPIAKQLAGESLANASRRIGGATDDAIHRIRNS